MAKPPEKGQLRVPPEALNAVILDEISGRLADLYTLQKEQIPEGVPVSFEDLSVTNITLIDLIDDRPRRPLFRIDIYNNGPNNVQAKINDSEEIEIKAFRTIPFDYHKAAIQKIQLRVDPGNTASVDITGLY